MATIENLIKRLKESGCDPKLADEVIRALEANALEEAEGRIVRTNKGALMVRLSPDRWPIGMYAKDWRILLSIVPAIEHALEHMNILEENPDKSPRQRQQTRAAQMSNSVQRNPNQPVMEDEEEDDDRGEDENEAVTRRSVPQRNVA